MLVSVDRVDKSAIAKVSLGKVAALIYPLRSRREFNYCADISAMGPKEIRFSPYS